MLSHKTWTWKHRGNFLLLPLNLNGWTAERIEVRWACQPHGQGTQKSAYEDVHSHTGYGIRRFIAHFSPLLTQKLSIFGGIQKQFHSHFQVLVSTVPFSWCFKEKKEDWRLNLHSFIQGVSLTSKAPLALYFKMLPASTSYLTLTPREFSSHPPSSPSFIMQSGFWL